MKKYVWIAVSLVVLGGFAVFLDTTGAHGEAPFGDAWTRDWVASGWYVIALVVPALLLCVFAVDDIIGYAERRITRRRVERQR